MESEENTRVERSAANRGAGRELNSALDSDICISLAQTELLRECQKTEGAGALSSGVVLLGRQVYL